MSFHRKPKACEFDRRCRTFSRVDRARAFGLRLNEFGRTFAKTMNNWGQEIVVKSHHDPSQLGHSRNQVRVVRNGPAIVSGGQDVESPLLHSIRNRRVNVVVNAERDHWHAARSLA
jgi:hypothetical protein